MELYVNGRINQTGIWEEGVNFMNELEIPLVLLLLSIQTGPVVPISLSLLPPLSSHAPALTPGWSLQLFSLLAIKMMREVMECGPQT